MSALFAVLLIGVRAVTGPELAVTVAAVSLLLTMSARHLVWIMSGSEFPRLLRRSSPSPYRTLAFLAAFDCLALLAIAILLLRWTTDSTFAMRWIPDEAKDLVALRHLTELPRRAGLSPLLVIVAFASAAFFASLANQLYKFGALHRDDDDRAWLSALLLEDGKFDQAVEVLESLDSDHVTGASLQAEIRLALARHKREEALALSRAFVAVVHREDPSEDAALVQLAQEAQHVRYPLTRLGGVLYVDETAAIRVWIIDRGRQASVSVGALIVISWTLGDPSELAFLTLASRPGQSENDVVIRSVLSHVWQPPTDDAQAQVDNVIDDLASVAVESLPRWSRAFLVEITGRLDHHARRLRLDRRQDLHTLRLRLVSTTPSDAAAILKDLDAAARARFNAGLHAQGRGAAGPFGAQTFKGDFY